MSISRRFASPSSAKLLLLCSLLPAGPTIAGTIYFGEFYYPERSDGTIHRVETDGSGLNTLVTVGGGLHAVAVDIANDTLYWSDTAIPAIRRSTLHGGQQKSIVTTGLEWPRSIALDPSGGKMYWGDQLTAEIRVADLDGQNSKLVRSTDFHAGLALDLVHGKIYWSTSITDVKGDILRMDLDGTHLEKVITETGKPAGVALDISDGKVYWTDYVDDVIRRANIDGTDIEDLYVVGSNRNPRPIALDLDEGKVYWGQDIEIYGNTGKIMRMDLNGSNPEDVVSGFGLIVDLTLGETHARLRGDMNCDAFVDFNDIDGFVLAIISRSQYEAAYPDCDWHLGDTNQDGDINFDDIDSFVGCLIDGGC